MSDSGNSELKERERYNLALAAEGWRRRDAGPCTGFVRRSDHPLGTDVHAGTGDLPGLCPQGAETRWTYLHHHLDRRRRKTGDLIH